MGFFKKFRRAVTKASKDVGNITQQAVAGVTGSETLGELAAGTVQTTVGTGLFGTTAGFSGTESVKEGFSRTGSALGLGGEEEVPEPVSALGGSSDSLIEKQKKDIEDNIRRNTTGLRQQSVLTAR